MKRTYSYIDALEAQRKAQHKFEYFFLGIILALISLSVQTFNPAAYPKAQYLIILFWGLLLAALLSGMYRQEKKDVFLQDETKIIYVREQIEFFEKVKRGEIILCHEPNKPWTDKKLEDKFKGFKTIEASKSKQIDKSNKYATAAYRCQKIAFLLALLIFISLRIINMNP